MVYDQFARCCVRSVTCQAWKKSMQHAAMDALQEVLEQPKAAVVGAVGRWSQVSASRLKNHEETFLHGILVYMYIYITQDICTIAI